MSSGWDITLTPPELDPLTITGSVEGDGIYLLSRQLSAPAQRAVLAASPEGDGADAADSRYDNRDLTYGVRVKGPDGATFRSRKATLTRALEQCHQRRGGTVDEVPPDGTDPWTLDVVDASLGDVETDRFGGVRQDFSIAIQTKPYGRLAKVSIAPHSEAANPLLIYDLSDVPGDSPALGQLSLVDTAAQARRWLAWGVEGRYLDPALPLFFPAETMTRSAGSSLAATAGAHGAGNNSVTRVLTGSLASMVELGNLAHVGLYRVFARAKVSAGTAGLSLVWTRGGDWAYATTNDEASLATSSFRILDLGLMQLDPPLVGDPLALAAIWARQVGGTGATLTLDWAVAMPAGDGYGELEAPLAGDSVIPASGTAVVRHDGALINTSASYWRRLSSGNRDPLLIPVGDSRLAVLPSRGARSLGEADGGTDDDLAAGLDYIPRVLYLPE